MRGAALCGVMLVALPLIGCPAEFSTDGSSGSSDDASNMMEATIDASDSTPIATDTKAIIDTAFADTAPADTNVVDSGCSADPQCDDKNACTVDRCAGGSCAHSALDGDGDGDGPKGAGCGGDCHDGNKSVFSAQLAYSEVAYMTTAGSMSFDYNCNGLEERELTAKVSCSMSTCTPGWVDTVPACGASGSWVTSCKTWMSSGGSNVCIEYYVVARKQACR